MNSDTGDVYLFYFVRIFPQLRNFEWIFRLESGWNLEIDRRHRDPRRELGGQQADKSDDGCSLVTTT